MNTKLHSFIDIFGSVYTADIEQVEIKKIIIPIIQRDYAQGRIDPDVNRVRERFLDSLYNAIIDRPITLDFVYGDVDAEGALIPLDGQQRLTTLFLLHWYAAKRENIPEEEMQVLRNFSYETRYSSRYFCLELVDFCPEFENQLSAEIVNQPWFPLDWKKDPTISSMLVMLDAIDLKFHDVQGIWEKLKNKAITFYFLPIKDMDLTDELYIKMNSRGKPLSLFEHFKAEFEREIKAIDEQLARRIIRKVDLNWTDLLWHYRDVGSGTAEDNTTDDEFLRYFKFICDVICYRKGESPQGKNDDEFDLLQQYFSKTGKDTISNVNTLESYFDCWINIPGYSSPTEFLKSFMTSGQEEGKISVAKDKVDIFEDCLHSYSDRSGKQRLFPLNRFVLLYAIICYLRNRDTVSREDFVRRIRIVNNLIQNSEDEVSDRIDRNRIPAILWQIDSIILTGLIDDSVENSFSPGQLKEEKEKIIFLENNPMEGANLFRLEDHPMLKGQISIVGLENLSLVDRFESLFECEWDLIDCALMATGDYGQRERNKWRFQYASSKIQLAWNELFHMSGNAGFEDTKNVLVSLLSAHHSFTNETLREITDEYIADCEARKIFPWRYYYVKYSEFRPGSYGKLSNEDTENKQYLFSVMQTRSQWSQNTYMPYLKAADSDHLSRDHFGQRLVYGDYHIVCENSSYLLRENATEEVVDTLLISQNEGIDTVDRVILLKDYLQGNQYVE